LCNVASLTQLLAKTEVILTELYFTLETFVRGFLMGYGSTILQDLLLKGKRAEEEVEKTKQFGLVVGTGLGCFLVGSSIFVPRSWRVAGFEL